MHDLGLQFEILRITAIDDAAFFHQEDARAQLERGFYILLDQQDRYAVLVDTMNLAPDLRDEARHNALGGLVEDDQPGPHHQAARDSKHLLLTARKRTPRLSGSLLEPGKAGEHILLALGIALAGHSQAQIFHYREVRKNPPPPRNRENPPARTLGGRAGRHTESVDSKP